MALPQPITDSPVSKKLPRLGCISTIRASTTLAQLGRFVSPDSIIPNPGDPVSFDRFAYVRNNPLKYSDPTGHCIEGSDDFDACMYWANEIEDVWGYVNVIVCLSGDSVEGCTGWTAEEMELLYKTLSDYPLEDYVDDGNISFIRTESKDYGGQYTPNTGEIRISDLAWTTPTLMGIQDIFNLFPSSNKFQGTIAHELTHAAQYTHPELRDKYQEEIARLSQFDRFLINLSVGVLYDWSIYKEYEEQPDLYNQLKQDEYMAMIVAGAVYGFGGK